VKRTKEWNGMFERVSSPDLPEVATDRNVSEYHPLYFLILGLTLAITPNVVAGGLWC
jgi:hypothetical protein